MRLASKVLPDVLDWYLTQLWGEGGDSVTVDFHERRASESPRHVDRRLGGGMCRTIHLLHGEVGDGLCLNLEHVYKVE